MPRYEKPSEEFLRETNGFIAIMHNDGNGERVVSDIYPAISKNNQEFEVQVYDRYDRERPWWNGFIGISPGSSRAGNYIFIKGPNLTFDMIQKQEEEHA